MILLNYKEDIKFRLDTNYLRGILINGKIVGIQMGFMGISKGLMIMQKKKNLKI